MSQSSSRARVLRYFEYRHLPDYLQEVSRPFHQLANGLHMTDDLNSDEVDAALRKLLEAKDCAVRAALREAAPRALGIRVDLAIDNSIVATGYVDDPPTSGSVQLRQDDAWEAVKPNTRVAIYLERVPR